jgi:signal peptidase I
LSKELQQAGWPLNWQPAGSGPGWTSPDQGETYHCPATDDTAWLHFRLYYVDEGVWTQIDQNVARGVSPLENNAAVEMPVTDFYAYNAQPRRFDSMGQEAIGMHWVGDLAIEADVDVRGETGQLELVLVEAGRQHVCRVDIASGQATLRIDEGRVRFADDGGAGAEQVTAATPIRGAGRHRLLFANVDDQLSLWVDGRLCQFDQQPTYGPTLGDRPQWGPVDPGDMHPVRIGVRQAEVELRRCRVLRDIYYIATTSALGTTTDYPRFDEGRRVINLLLDPRRWQQGDLFDRRQTVVFKMQKDQFFPLGDNSPYSRDGRLWGREHFVERDMLIGEAVLIYWPHGWRIAIPGTGIVLPPIIPNVQKMGLIH